MIKRSEEYIEILFNDARPHELPSIEDNINETGPSITKSQVIHAIRNQKKH